MKDFKFLTQKEGENERQRKRKELDSYISSS